MTHFESGPSTCGKTPEKQGPCSITVPNKLIQRDMDQLDKSRRDDWQTVFRNFPISGGRRDPELKSNLNKIITFVILYNKQIKTYCFVGHRWVIW